MVPSWLQPRGAQPVSLSFRKRRRVILKRERISQPALETLILNLEVFVLERPLCLPSGRTGHLVITRRAWAWALWSVLALRFLLCVQQTSLHVSLGPWKRTGKGEPF